MLIAKILKDLKQSQFNKDEIKTSTLRLLLSEVKNAQIARGSSGEELSDQEIVSVIKREIKRRKEAAAGFRLGGKEDQALKEEVEQKVLESYLPVQLAKEALTKIVEESISEAGQLALVKGLEKPSLQDMGKIIRLVMEKVKGRADGGVVSALVKEKLS